MYTIYSQKNIIRAAFLFIAILYSCNSGVNKQIEYSQIDYDTIKKNGKLVAAIDYNSTSYFIYRGEPMGYNYELMKWFCDEHHLDLEVKGSNNLTETFEMLNIGLCDVIAMNLNITPERKKILRYTKPICKTKQVLVQRSSNSKKIDKIVESQDLVKSAEELGGKSLHIQANSAYYTRLMHLSQNMENPINVIEVSNYESEQLISLVANGNIDYAVCDENVAKVNKRYYPHIDISVAISDEADLAWGVRKNSIKLNDSINIWLDKVKETVKYRVIYNKYYKTSRVLNRLGSGYLSTSSGNISVYDDMIKKYSKNIDWDWRLLASLIAQESMFRHDVVSWAGAFGLMQLMPSTAEQYGVNAGSSPEKNIESGVKYIKWIDKSLEGIIVDKGERLRFVLASYNAGIGHVLDARRLAEKHGSNPNVWENNVERYILFKSKPEYYLDPVVKYGYCRGEQTYEYVRSVLSRHIHYKNMANKTEAPFL